MPFHFVFQRVGSGLLIQDEAFEVQYHVIVLHIEGAQQSVKVLIVAAMLIESHPKSACGDVHLAYANGIGFELEAFLEGLFTILKVGAV